MLLNSVVSIKTGAAIEMKYVVKPFGGGALDEPVGYVITQEGWCGRLIFTGHHNSGVSLATCWRGLGRGRTSRPVFTLAGIPIDLRLLAVVEEYARREHTCAKLHSLLLPPFIFFSGLNLSQSFGFGFPVYSYPIIWSPASSTFPPCKHGD